jgi:shikimate kinase
MTNLVFCGFMGSGKSRLGRYLSMKLNLKFEDLDDCIQNKMHMSISAIFTKYGQEYFRQIERELLTEKSSDAGRILSLGGGSLGSQEVVDLIKSSNVLVFIAPDFETLLDRIQGKSKRPLVLNVDGSYKTREQLVDDLLPLYKNRLKYYNQAHITFVPDSRWAPDESGERLFDMIKNYQYEG